MAACGSRVLLAERGIGVNTLYVLDVSAEHTVRHTGNVLLHIAINGLACTRRENDTLVALSNRTSVSLQRLPSESDTLRLEPVDTSVGINAPHHLIFCGELLLVADWKTSNERHAIFSLRATNDGLTQWQVLFDAHNSVDFSDWAIADNRLVLFDRDCGCLRVYFFE